TATAAATSTGTPAGTNGTLTSAAIVARAATMRGRASPSRGASSARNAAGAAASRPSARGSLKAVPDSAPTSVAAFQNANTARPVDQKPRRVSAGVGRPTAIAADSSITNWAAS